MPSVGCRTVRVLSEIIVVGTPEPIFVGAAAENVIVRDVIQRELVRVRTRTGI